MDVPDSPAGTPAERDLRDALLDVLATGVIATDDRLVIRWFNRGAAEFFPQAEVGRSIYELLGKFTHEQKIDRMVLRREMIAVSFGDLQPATGWMNCDRRLADGGHLLMVWPVSWTTSMIERRASFAMAAFHELRTPLTALLGFAEMLAGNPGNLDSEQREAVGMITVTAKQISELTADVFDLARNSFGELRLNLQKVALAPLVLSVVEVHRSQAAGKCDRLDLEIAPDLPAVEADPTRIRQVVDNLISNACLHNPEDTLVEVNLRRAEDGIKLIIRDHGIGLGLDDPSDAFQTFYRGQDALDEGIAGSGIGLPLAKRLIELHRGRLTLENPHDGGTRVSVWLPLDRSRALTPGERGPA